MQQSATDWHRARPLILLAVIAGILMLAGYLLLEPIYREDSDLGRDLFIVKSLFNPKLIKSVDTGGEKLAALTFDDGPDPRFTPQVLEILKHYDVKATFFVIGQSAVLYPDLIRQEVNAGHEIENHTYTHPYLEKDSGLRVEEEISQTEAVIETLTHRKPAYFRPPRRLFNQKVIDIADLNGYQMILWEIGIEHHAAKTPADMAQRVIDKASLGIIILAHDGRLNRTRTIEALPLVIQGYQDQGYRFVTLAELMKRGAQVKAAARQKQPPVR